MNSEFAINPGGGGSIEVGPGVSVREEDLRFAFTRSSGPGGQNVNKVATRVEARLPVEALRGLSAAARQRLRQLAGRRLTRHDELVIASGRYRSQVRNREQVLSILRELVVRAQVEPKVRRPTRPTRSAVEGRLSEKRRRATIKNARRRPEDSQD